MPVASIACPIAPPSASISRTICPLPTPPIAGLQLIWPTVSQLVVNSAVRAPRRAAARAASVPAWPAPTTITSYSYCVEPMHPAYCPGAPLDTARLAFALPAASNLEGGGRVTELIALTIFHDELDAVSAGRQVLGQRE